MLSYGIVHASQVAGLLSLIDGVTNAIDVRVAKNKGNLEQEIVIISQLCVINVQQLHDLDCLVVRWDTTDNHSIWQEECEPILIEMEMLQKIGTPVPYGGFLLTNLKFKTWLHLKMLIDTETPLTSSSCPPSVNCNGQEIDMSAFPIRWPHPEDLHLICCLIEHSLLPHINCVIDHHKHMFVTHNIAHLFCNGHLDDILTLYYFITLSLQLWKKTTQIWYWDSLTVVLQL